MPEKGKLHDIDLRKKFKSISLGTFPSVSQLKCDIWTSKHIRLTIYSLSSQNFFGHTLFSKLKF